MNHNHPKLNRKKLSEDLYHSADYFDESFIPSYARYLYEVKTDCESILLERITIFAIFTLSYSQFWLNLFVDQT